MGHPYTETLFVVYLTFRFNRVPCFVSWVSVCSLRLAVLDAGCLQAPGGKRVMGHLTDLT